ncbi:MAG: glycerophosphodiester phosphodiesterase family protein, partial [Eubacteriales bacterium]
MPSNTTFLADKGNTKFVAHRGVSGLECENTAAAFIAAGNRTYYGVETDIYHTADHRYLCSHDAHTGRICDADLVIEQSTFDDLRALRLRDK